MGGRQPVIFWPRPAAIPAPAAIWQDITDSAQMKENRKRLRFVLVASTHPSSKDRRGNFAQKMTGHSGSGVAAGMSLRGVTEKYGRVFKRRRDKDYIHYIYAMKKQSPASADNSAIGFAVNSKDKAAMIYIERWGKVLEQKGAARRAFAVKTQFAARGCPSVGQKPRACFHRMKTGLSQRCRSCLNMNISAILG
ncbi:MAG: hypothetical protein LBO03_07725 [Acidaminococcales bacterium]|jgi:hypothetical protein|nr:hypothetical protein [Acidaminococcales bacterium]